MPEVLADGFGRVVRDLRVSVTDRCNFRCTYCMPVEGMVWQDRSELLTFEELERVVGVFVRRYGVNSVRLTGGEPTVRAHLPVLVAKLARLEPRPELALTTNGATLAMVAGELADAGLDRINISCDSLRPERFFEITRRDALTSVLEGIDAAIAAGLHPVKINCVLVRGVNDDEIVDFARFGRERGVGVRFIEWMPLDAQGEWDGSRVVPSAEVIAEIASVFPLEPLGRNPQDPQPADRFRYADAGSPAGPRAGGEEVGVIASVTQPFCGDCDRVRLTADGQLRTCLFGLDEHDLRSVLRGSPGEAAADAVDAVDDQLAAVIRGAVAAKWAGHAIGRVTFVRPPRSMSQIGG